MASGNCVACGHDTDLCCSDCRIDLKTTVYVCQSSVCRDRHEAGMHGRRFEPTRFCTRDLLLFMASEQGQGAIDFEVMFELPAPFHLGLEVGGAHVVQRDRKLFLTTRADGVARLENWIKYKRPVVVPGAIACVFRHHEERVETLLAGRRVEYKRGQLQPPGGKVQHGESRLRAATRELYEETGLEVSALTEGVTVDHLPTEKTDWSWIGTYFGHFVPADCVVQDKEPEKLDPWAWYPLDLLDNLPLFCGTAAADAIRLTYNALARSR